MQKELARNKWVAAQVEKSISMRDDNEFLDEDGCSVAYAFRRGKKEFLCIDPYKSPREVEIPAEYYLGLA